MDGQHDGPQREEVTKPDFDPGRGIFAASVGNGAVAPCGGSEGGRRWIACVDRGSAALG